MVANYYSQSQQYLQSPLSALDHIGDYEVADKDYILALLDFAYTEEQEYYSEDQIEYVINQCKLLQLSYVKLGLYYWEIKSRKLYKQTHANFKPFCEQVLRKTHYTVNNYITAARITLQLIAEGCEHLPLHVSHCLELAKLPADRLLESWNLVLEIYQPHEITLERIKLALFPPEPGSYESFNRIDVKPSVYEKLTYNAFKLKLTINDYIELLLERVRKLDSVRMQT